LRGGAPARPEAVTLFAASGNTAVGQAGGMAGNSRLKSTRCACIVNKLCSLIEVVFQNFIDVGIEAFYQGVAFAARASTCTPRPAPTQPRTRSPLTGCASGTRSRWKRSSGCCATYTRSSSDSRWSRAGGTRAVALQAARRTQGVAQAAQSAHLHAEARETERVLRVEVALLREPRRRSARGGCD
jgi:hypothetical protein